MTLEYILCKEKRSEHFDGRVRYYSTTDNAYFDYGKSPLSVAKAHARNGGFKTMRLLGNRWNEPDKIYIL